MGVEIERKFLVKGDPWGSLPKPEGTMYRQGYIAVEPGRTVRVRVAGHEGFLTIKGSSSGGSRSEYEYRIPVVDATELLEKFCGPKVVKTRYRVPHGGRTWEVDVFEGDNAGLVVAEIELEHPSDTVVLPEWVGKEVTDDHRYSNSSLSMEPYRKWAGAQQSP